MEHDYISIGIVFVVSLGIAALWLAWRLRLPAIVLLAAAGILAGPVFGLVNRASSLESFCAR